jgi:hypothetical protein
MIASYEDNFGYWEIDSPQESAFFVHVQRQSALVNCQRCHSPVRLLPTKTVCAACISALECGAPASMRKYRSHDAVRREPPCQTRRLLRPRAH